MALYKESDNSDDPALRRQVDGSGDKLKAAITPFVENGKAVASSPNDQGLITAWRMAANKLLDIVAEVTRLFADLNMYGYDSRCVYATLCIRCSTKFLQFFDLILLVPPKRCFGISFF